MAKETVLHVIEGEAKTVDEIKGDLADALKTFGSTTGQAALDQMADQLVIESALPPPLSKIVINQPFAGTLKQKEGEGTPSGGGISATGLLKPKVTLFDKQGKVTAQYMPAGDPAKSYGLKVGIIMGGLLFVTGIFSAGRYSKKTRR